MGQSWDQELCIALKVLLTSGKIAALHQPLEGFSLYIVNGNFVGFILLLFIIFFKKYIHLPKPGSHSKFPRTQSTQAFLGSQEAAQGATSSAGQVLKSTKIDFWWHEGTYL